MHIRCPHCHNPVEVAHEVHLREVICPSCGSSFNLLGDETITYRDHRPRTLAHFELTDELGIGAFGSVWKAWDKQLERIVAVKIPRSDQLSAPDVEKFLREARAAAQLRHPNIVSVHEIGRVGSTVYIVSDYIEGVTLADWLTAHRPTVREAAETIAKIAGALQYAHETGVVHRDLKPSNIMLGPDNEPHILDFGLAKRAAAEITMTVDGQILGTPAYMPPEQAVGDAHTADARSDIYSLGVILFELLTGERPFRGNTRMLIHQVIHDEAPSPRKFNAAVSRDLETICLKCLEKKPDRRYQSGGELAADMRRFLDHRPIAARPVSRLARLSRWCRREPKIAAAITAVVVVAALAFGVVDYHRRVAEGERQHALTANNTLDRVNDDLVASLAATADAKTSAESALARNGALLARQYLDRAIVETEGGDYNAGRLLALLANETAAENNPVRQSARNFLHKWSHEGGLSLPLEGDVTACAFSEDETHLAIASGRKVQVWNVEEYTPVGEAMTYTYPVLAVAYRHSDRKLLIATAKAIHEAVRDDNRPSGRSTSHVGIVREAIFSKDGSFLVALLSKESNTDDEVVKYDTATGEIIGKPIPVPDAHSFHIDDAATKAVIWDRDHLHIWRLDGSTREAKIKPTWANNFRFALSPTGERLVVSDNLSVRLYEVSTQEVIANHYVAGLSSAAFTAEGKVFVAVCRDGIACGWDVESGEAVLHGSLGSAPVSRMLFGSHRFFYCWRDEGETRGTIAASLALTKLKIASPFLTHGTFFVSDAQSIGNSADVWFVGYAQNGKLIATAEESGVLRLWEATTKNLIAKPLRHDRPVKAVAVSADGGTLLTLTCGEILAGKVWLWDLKNLDRPQEIVTPAGMAISADCQKVLVQENDSMARLYHVRPFKPFGTAITPSDEITTAEFDPSGRLLVTRCVDGTVRLWDARTGKPRGANLANLGRVIATGWSHDGSLLITMSADDADMRTKVTVTEVASGKPVTVVPVAFVGAAVDLDARRSQIYLHGYISYGGGNVFWPTVAFDLLTGQPLGWLTTKKDGLLAGTRKFQLSPQSESAVFTGATLDGGLPFRERQLEVKLPALTSDAEILRLWVGVQSGSTIDAEGNVRVLSLPEWTAKRKRLEQLGGPPVPWWGIGRGEFSTINEYIRM